jgi:putative tricarboxylic transport membrane protein
MASDRWAGLLFLLLALAYGALALGLDPGFVSDPVGPKAFPLLVALLMGASALYLMVRPDPEPLWPGREFWYRALALVASLVGYAYLLRPLGFLPLTALEVALLGVILGLPWQRALVFGLVLALGLYALFSGIGISLPRGHWFGG